MKEMVKPLRDSYSECPGSCIEEAVVVDVAASLPTLPVLTSPFSVGIAYRWRGQIYEEERWFPACTAGYWLAGVGLLLGYPNARDISDLRGKPIFVEVTPQIVTKKEAARKLKEARTDEIAEIEGGEQWAGCVVER